MPLPKIRNSFVVTLAVVIALGCGLAYFFWSLAPRAAAGAAPVEFEITPGRGFSEIANDLAQAGIIRQATAFKLLALLSGEAGALKAGRYELSPSASARNILETLVDGAVAEVEVVIPEGSTVYQIDDILAQAGVIKSGALVSYVLSSSRPLEGRLYPDRYRLFVGSKVEDVVARLTENFDRHIGSVLPNDPAKAQNVIILASMLEKEVPDEIDRRLVAGIILKRLDAKMPLQVDATICYGKQVIARAAVKCGSLSLDDLKLNSPYNTYRNLGLPPGPIGNPAEPAVEAALRPASSRYWYYLSDPKTGKTIFSETLDEHAQNRVKYLK
ncbi:MAG TPA: endolytic transglycosylase MltG [Candidatus Paceibacterota bacterium]|nr:endolytic transglycosylase MltG [Candidatus Paceibacterota bacterium]